MMKHRFRQIVLAALVVALATCGASTAGAQTFEEWYAQPENREWYEFQQWYGASERNAVWYHIRDEFGNGHVGDQAVRVADCESELDPGASSETNDHGVFQINRPSWYYRFQQVTGQPWSSIYHASHNSRFAKWLYDETGGWSHWTCRHAA